jgi:hypothetical protein
MGVAVSVGERSVTEQIEHEAHAQGSRRPGIAATGAIGVVGTGADARAGSMPRPAPVKVAKPGGPVQTVGSSWQ